MEKEWIRGKCIGRGSFGTVSLAYDKSGGVFAVKSVQLSPAPSQPSIDSLENEIAILRSLDSPYIVSYLGDSTTTTWRNLHVEYVPGGTLADVAGNLGELQLRCHVRSLLLALSYLHSVAGVVHGDVKGRNVLLGPTAAKLADFGSAKLISGPSAGPTTRLSGTPLWMAPEVIRGAPPTPASDVWSVGCTVIEAYTGRCPWGNVGRAGLYDIGYGSRVPELPSGMSKMERDFVEKCLRREAGERWTAEELLSHPFVAELEECGARNVGGSPRSTLDWVSSKFEEEEEEEEEEERDEGEGEVEEKRRGAIWELAKGCEGVNWGDEDGGWMVVR